MLMLDPYYRTIEGFMKMVDREWSQMGHQVCLLYAFHCIILTIDSLLYDVGMMKEKKTNEHPYSSSFWKLSTNSLLNTQQILNSTAACCLSCITIAMLVCLELLWRIVSVPGLKSKQRQGLFGRIFEHNSPHPVTKTYISAIAN